MPNLFAFCTNQIPTNTIKIQVERISMLTFMKIDTLALEFIDNNQIKCIIYLDHALIRTTFLFI